MYIVFTSFAKRKVANRLAIEVEGHSFKTMSTKNETDQRKELLISLFDGMNGKVR